MLINKDPQVQNQTQTTNYSLSIGKQIVKGLALIGLCVAGMYGVAQWFFSTMRNNKDMNVIEEDGVTLEKKNPMIADHYSQLLPPVKNSDNSVFFPKSIHANELDLTYQSNEFTNGHTNYHAQPELTNSNNLRKYGDIFRVNIFPNYFLGSQTPGYRQKSVATLSNGNFIIAWEELLQTGELQHNLKARIFDIRGNPISDPLLIINNSDSLSIFTSIYTAKTSKGFIILFKNATGIYAQLLNENGGLLKTIKANSNEIYDVSEYMLADLTNDNFVIGWNNYFNSSLRIFDNAGNGLTDDIAFVEKTITSISKLPNGSFVILGTMPFNNSRVFFQIVNKNGYPLNEPVLLNTTNQQFRLFPLNSFAANNSFLLINSQNKLATIYSDRGVELTAPFTMNAEVLIELNNGHAGAMLNGKIDNTNVQNITFQLYSSQLETQGSLAFIEPYGDIPPAAIRISELIGIAVLPNDDVVVSWQTGFWPGLIDSGVYARIINFVTNTQLTAFFINFADSYRQDSPYIFSNTEIDCFNCTQPITFIAKMSDPKAGYLISSFNDKNITSIFDNVLGQWQVTGVSSHINPILKKLTYIPASSYYQNFTLAIQVNDAANSTVSGNIKMMGVQTLYTPSIITNVLTLNQGDKITLRSQNLAANSGNPNIKIIQFYVTAIQHGYFYTDSKLSILNFSKQQIEAGNINFAHDNSIQAPSYTIIAYNGQLNSTAMPVTVYFNRPPVLGNNQLTIQNRGEKIVFDLSMISATDPDDPQDQLKFIVTNIQHGQFELVNISAQATISFIQKQVSSSEVIFVHDGSDQTPYYQVSVTDSKATTVSQPANITFLPKVAETSNDQSYNNMVIGTTVGVTAGTVALIGGIYGLWRYRKSREFAEERKKYPLANALLEKLRLANVEDFQSEKGLSYLNAISQINNELRARGIDVGQMLAEEIEQLAGHIASGIKKTLPHKKTCTGVMKLDFTELGNNAALILDLRMPLNSYMRPDSNEIEVSNVI